MTQESVVILYLHDSLMTATQTETDSVPPQEDIGPIGPALGSDGLNPHAQPFEFMGQPGPMMNTGSDSETSTDQALLYQADPWRSAFEGAPSQPTATQTPIFP